MAKALLISLLSRPTIAAGVPAGLSAFSASKFAIRGMTKAVARELGEDWRSQFVSFSDVLTTVKFLNEVGFDNLSDSQAIVDKARAFTGPVALGAWGVSLALIVLLRPWFVRHAMARPNARSSHSSNGTAHDQRGRVFRHL